MKKLLLKIYDEFYETYGPQHWWPGDSPWEIAVGAVLTQNTNWKNVEKAIAGLVDEALLSPEAIMSVPLEKLATSIKPSGYFRLKSQRLKNLAQWWWSNHKDIFDGKLTMDEARESLLGVNGVGPETADCILLYSFNMTTFVIDTYTKKFFSTEPRFLKKVNKNLEKMKYEDWRGIFMNNLPHDFNLFNEYHALIVINGKKLANC